MFNTLLATLQRNRKQLDRLNQRLEERIAARTRQLAEQYYRDPVTNLPNRFQLEEDLQSHTAACIAILKLNGFRTINELFGHSAGDTGLQEIARRLSVSPKNFSGTLYRVGADEFAILCTASDLSADRFAQHIREIQTALEQEPLTLFQQHLPLFVTAGISCSPQRGLEQAQMAMHLAQEKQTRLELYDNHLYLESLHQKNLYWLQELQEAFHANRLVTYYQPIFDLRQWRVSHYEALARLVDQHGQIVPPGNFLSTAKKTTLYPQITEAVLKQAFARFSSLADCGFSVNLGPADIRSPKIRRLIAALLSSFPHPGQVIFEFVETDEISDFPELLSFIHEVRPYGVKIAIDDFGSGYSNFANIVEMEVDYLKIDGSLIRQLGTNAVAREVVTHIVRFARALEIQVVAEFISSQLLFELVQGMDIDYAQGYFIGTPQPELTLVPQPDNQP